jgi:hypothetical protein
LYIKIIDADIASKGKYIVMEAYRYWLFMIIIIHFTWAIEEARIQISASFFHFNFL